LFSIFFVFFFFFAILTYWVIHIDYRCEVRKKVGDLRCDIGAVW
jgi:hypothetical protein